MELQNKIYFLKKKFEEYQNYLEEYLQNFLIDKNKSKIIKENPSYNSYNLYSIFIYIFDNSLNDFVKLHNIQEQNNSFLSYIAEIENFSYLFNLLTNNLNNFDNKKISEKIQFLRSKKFNIDFILNSSLLKIFQYKNFNHVKNEILRDEVNTKLNIAKQILFYVNFFLKLVNIT